MIANNRQTRRYLAPDPPDRAWQLYVEPTSLGADRAQNGERIDLTPEGAAIAQRQQPQACIPTMEGFMIIDPWDTPQ